MSENESQTFFQLILSFDNRRIIKQYITHRMHYGLNMKPEEKLKYYLKRIGKFFAFYFSGLYHRLDKGHVFLMAGGLGFSLFICLIPFVLIIFSVLGTILELPNVRSQISLFIDTAIPYTKSAKAIKTIIYDRIDEFSSYKSFARYLGIFGLLVAASGLFSSMRTILNNIFGVSEGKNILIGKLRDFGMVLLVILFFMFSISILPLLEIFKDSIGTISFFNTFTLNALQKFLISGLPMLVMFLIFYLIYNLVTYEKLHRKVILISALWATILWEAAKQIFGFYITNFATLTRIYGTYIFIIVFVFWIYYSSLIFIVSAHIGQLYRERNHLIKNSRRAKRKKTKE